jgi:hypothetical protein
MSIFNFNNMFGADKNHKNLSDQYSSSGFESPPPVPWSKEEEAEFQKEAEDRFKRTKNLKKDVFLSLPIEVREGILDIQRKHIIGSSIESIAYSQADPSAREIELAQRKAKCISYEQHLQHGSMSGNYRVSYQDLMDIRYRSDDPVDDLLPYDEMLEAHAEKAAREILLNDKD